MRSRSRSPGYRRRSRSRSRSGDRFRDRSPPRGGGRRSPPRGGRGGGDEKISLLVRNISDRIDPEDLRDLFSKYGVIKDIYVPLDYYTKRPKPFAFIEFINFNEARDAKESLDRREFQGRQIDVVFAQQRRKTPDQMRSRDAPYRGGGGGGGGRDNYSPSPRRRRDSRSPRRDRSRSPRRSPPRRDSPRRDSPKRERDRDDDRSPRRDSKKEDRREDFSDDDRRD
mmetsp:Transcript_8488/g.16911  ORF Transcript_8488/g.16911 Transcript_8488/m.16911 type:complete len:225 (+) Transcript_8488:125-799(+)